MSLLDRVLQIYSSGSLGLLCLFFLGVGVVAKLTGNPVQFSMLPWTGNELTNWVIGLSLLGLAAIALSAAGKFRWLLAIFACYVFAQMFWGFYMGPHRFDGYDDFRQSITMCLGAFAAAGSAIRLALVRR